jgi:branched-chain amino acid aminotransferase
MADESKSAQMNTVAYFRGAFMPLSEANVNLASHGLHYGTGLFEGIRAYWNAEQGQLFGLLVKEHFERMTRNARMLRIQLPHTPDELVAITQELLERNNYRQHVYIRPIAFKDDFYFGLKLSGLKDSFGIYTLPLVDYLDTRKGLHLGVSSWRRPDDNAVPSRGKLTGSYVNACMAVDDAHLSGFDDAIMLTPDGHVAEASGANIFMVRSGRIVTTPVSDAILEGITRGAVMEIAGSLGLEVDTRPIDRTELYVADEIFLCGTGVQVAPVTQVDHRPLGDGTVGPITEQIQKAYVDAVRGKVERYHHWLTPVYGR